MIDQEVFDLEPVITLELDHLAKTLGLGVANDGAIASCSTVSAPPGRSRTEMLETYRIPS